MVQKRSVVEAKVAYCRDDCSRWIRHTGIPCEDKSYTIPEVIKKPEIPHPESGIGRLVKELLPEFYDDARDSFHPIKTQGLLDAARLSALAWPKWLPKTGPAWAPSTAPLRR